MLGKLLLPFALASLSSAMRLSGVANLNKEQTQMHFVGKFCYTFQRAKNFSSATTPPCGAMDFVVRGALKDTGNYWFVSYDNANYLTMKNDPTLSCQQKISMGQISYQFATNQFSRLSKLKEHIVPRWWYSFIINCNKSTAPQDLRYDAHFYQLNEPDWTKEFGVNEEGLNSMYLFYTVFYVLVAGVQVFAYFQYKSQQYVHQLIKILTASVIIQLLASAVHFIDWALFAQAGDHQAFFVFAATIFDVAAMTVFMVLLFLLAQGWTISNLTVSYVGFITCFALTVAGFRIGFFAWRYETYITSTSVKYFYNSPPMYAYGSLMIVVGLAFVVQSFMSYRMESDAGKRRLYLILAGLYFFWFLSPLLTILFANAVAEYYRDTFAYAFVESANAIALTVMVGLMYPSWAHQYFNLKIGLDAQSMLINSTGDYKAITAGMQSNQEDDL